MWNFLKFSIDLKFLAKKALDQDPESGIRIRIKIKPWIRIRISIKAYADQKHCINYNLFDTSLESMLGMTLCACALQAGC